MPRYYFDSRTDDTCTFDDVGVILEGTEAARKQAMRTLADCSKGIAPGPARKVLGIEVRDEDKQALLELKLVFHATSPR